MLGQKFALVDIPLLFILIGMEIILSSDNVIAISSIARRLPQNKRLKAIWIGFLSAFVLRGIVILGAALFIRWPAIKILGALYLIFLSAKFFIPMKSQSKKDAKTESFWKIVALVELTDLIFAIDSILAGIALIGVPAFYHGLYPKLWIVYIGGLSGACVMRFAAGWTMQLLDRFPRLSSAAHALIGLVGIKLLIETILHSIWIPLFFWPLFFCILLLGFTQKKK